MRAKAVVRAIASMALRAWGCEAIVCTVDTVLGLVQNQRKGLYAWPGLAHAAVVFDEIHAYDDALFGALLRFLEGMPGTPALLMTASLPADRMTALRGLVGRLHNATLAEIEGPPELERLPRYVRVDAEPLAAAQQVLDSGGKVLWVSNTVGRCISIVDMMPGRPHLPFPFSIHRSRPMPRGGDLSLRTGCGVCCDDHSGRGDEPGPLC